MLHLLPHRRSPLPHPAPASAGNDAAIVSLPRRGRRGWAAGLIAAAVALGSGCTDGNPAGAGRPRAEPPGQVVTALACAVEVKAGTLSCRPQEPRVGAGALGVLLGGQDQYVRLASSNVGYDGVDVFQGDVTVQNLTTQTLGTHDEQTAAAEGVRVFFHSGPTATGGSGAVSVTNADGTGTFTAGGQPYFQYPGVLATGVTSASRTWQFSVPSTVTSFAFTVYVAAPVRNEAGWVQVTPPGPSLRAGTTGQFTATVRHVTGAEQEGLAVSWSSSNPAVATVDGNGLVTAVAAGTATITATSGARSGSVDVRVGATPGDNTPPTVLDLAFDRRWAQASGADSVVSHMSFSDSGGLFLLFWYLGNPSHNKTYTCGGFASFAPVISFRCRFTIAAGDEHGLWQLDSVVVRDAGGNTRKLTGEQIRTAGWPAGFQVVP